MNHRLKRLAAAAVSVLLLTVSCSQAPQEGQQEILSQKRADKNKTQITVLVKHAFSINEFEKAVEEKFPQVDLVQVGNYSRDMGKVEYERRIANDDLTDIVMTWPLNIGEEYWGDRLIDLSGMEFTSRYHISMLDTISRDGKLYYLPGPAQVRGIVYNKTLFKEKGWEIPKDFDGFVALCQEIEKSGIRSIQLGFANQEVLDTAFVGYSFGSCFSKPKDTQWLEAYNKGNGSIGSQLTPAFDTFQKMIDAGIWKKSDLQVDYAQREKMLFTRQCAMVEDSVLMARMGFDQTGTTDEFALMPFFNPDGSNDWARLYMVCYIGLNKHLTEPKNEEKYETVLQLMDYISTPDGQAALAADTGAMYSSVKNVPPPNITEIEALVPTLNAGRYAIFPELKNAQSAMRSGLAGLLDGTMTRDEVIHLVDSQNVAPKQNSQEEVIGKASSDFTIIETGNFITDTMREKTGTEIALFLDDGKDGRHNGKGVSGRLYQGEQRRADVMRVFPDLRDGEKGIVQKVTMTGASLLDTLEYAIAVDNDSRGWFYYFSGLKMEYAPWAEAGMRIRSITDADGNKIDSGKIYTVAVMDGSVPEEYMLSKEDTEIYIPDLLCDAIQEKGTISPSGDGRFKVTPQ